MNQPEQPIEALLDEVDAKYAGDVTPVPFVPFYIPSQGWAVCWAGPTTAQGFGPERNLYPICHMRWTDGMNKQIEKRLELECELLALAYSAVPRLSRELRQRIEREQELAAVLKLETHIKDGLREELTLANLTIADLRQQLEQQQQSEEMTMKDDSNNPDLATQPAEEGDGQSRVSFTPGPWEDFTDGYRGHEIRATQPFKSIGYVTGAADARLIAAAPQLYEVVQKIRSEHNYKARTANFPACGCHDCALLVAALAAVADKEQ